MNPESLKTWREQLYGTGYGTRSKLTAAKALGLSLRTYESYEAGVHRIPRYIALACAALKCDLPPVGYLAGYSVTYVPTTGTRAAIGAGGSAGCAGPVSDDREAGGKLPFSSPAAPTIGHGRR